MKPKQHGLAAVVACLAAVVAAGLLFLFGPRHGVSPVRRTRLPAVNDVSVPEQPVLAQISRLERKMAMLAGSLVADTTPVRLALFGHRPASIRTGEGGVVSADDSLAPDYELTLAFDAGKKRFCMIDGELLEEGAVLDDSAIVLKIESRRVLVEKDAIRKWIYLSDPMKSES